jgi:hypothetical protein
MYMTLAQMRRWAASTERRAVKLKKKLKKMEREKKLADAKKTKKLAAAKKTKKKARK